MLESVLKLLSTKVKINLRRKSYEQPKGRIIQFKVKSFNDSFQCNTLETVNNFSAIYISTITFLLQFAVHTKNESNYADERVSKES